MDELKLCVGNSFRLNGAFEMYGANSHIINANNNMLENRDSVYYLMSQSCYSDAELLNILLLDFDGHTNVQTCSIYKNI